MERNYKKNCNILLLQLSFSAGRMEIVLRGNVFIIEQKTSVTGEREFLSENFVPVWGLGIRLFLELVQVYLDPSLEHYKKPDGDQWLKLMTNITVGLGMTSHQFDEMEKYNSYLATPPPPTYFLTYITISSNTKMFGEKYSILLRWNLLTFSRGNVPSFVRV